MPWAFNPFTGNLDKVVKKLSLGTSTQIPYMNLSDDDFLYSSDFTFDGSALTLTADLVVNSLSQLPLLEVDYSENRVWIGAKRDGTQLGVLNLFLDNPPDLNGDTGSAGLNGYNFNTQKGQNIIGSGGAFGSAGNAGNGYFSTNAGGAASGTFAFLGQGGTGGKLVFETGVGGSCFATSGFLSGAGAGGPIEFSAGDGGSSSVSNSANSGGSGGSISFTSGDGGDANNATTNNGGGGGNILFYAGKPGSGSTSNGVPGYVEFWVKPTVNTIKRMFRMSGATETVEYQFAPTQNWDNIRAYYGTAKDASIYYNGLNLIINPKDVGSGIVDIRGILETDGYRSADGTNGATYSGALTFKNGLYTSGSFSYGSTTQIPYMNGSGSNFLYSSNFTFDGSTLSLVGTSQLGDGGTTNYTQFDATGHQTMHGSARPWRDQLTDAISIKVLGVGISSNASEGTQDFLTSANLSDYLYLNMQLNHDKDLSSDIYAHIHFFQAENNAPNFLLQYRWQVDGGAKATSWTNLTCNTLVHTYSTGTIHQISYAAPITPPAGTALSDIVQFRILRDNGNSSGLFAGSDPYTTTVGILAFDCHFQINSLGSDDQYTK